MHSCSKLPPGRIGISEPPRNGQWSASDYREQLPRPDSEAIQDSIAAGLFRIEPVVTSVPRQPELFPLQRAGELGDKYWFCMGT